MFTKADVERGCGSSRDIGGVYWETGFSKNGIPLEKFIVCPPTPIDEKKMGLSPKGILMIQTEDGVYHVLDWVGAIHYPNVTDFLEEARRFGVSRRLELSKNEYALLTKKSRLLAVHPAGFILKTKPYYLDRQHPPFYDWNSCPQRIELHDQDNIKNPYPMCAGLWWEDVIFADSVDNNSRLSLRTMPEFKYRCASPPGKNIEHAPALIATFPLGRIAIVEDPEGQTHLEKIVKLSDLNPELTFQLVEK